MRIHGMSFHPIYSAWNAMKQRCSNKNHPWYHDYGGRGITYVEEWEPFLGFLKDMEAGWEKGLTLDRIDNEGNYEPSNCRWATVTQQVNNSRRNVKIEYRGKTQSALEWSKELGLTRQCIYSRRLAGLPPEYIFKHKSYYTGKGYAPVLAELRGK